MSSWLVLIHQLPPEPSYLRVKVGRRLQRIGAVQIKNTVYVLPATEQCKEDLQWTIAEIREGGGEANLFESKFLDGITDEEVEERFNDEIEELLSLLGLSQSMIKTTNQMVVPPEGDWQAPEDCRAIINPGGVGQPRDGDPRAAFMIYDTERGFTFYRVPYPFEKTQEKIIQAGLPQYLATRLAYGR